MLGRRLALTLTLALFAGSALAQEAPPLSMAEAPVPEPAQPSASPRAPIIVPVQAQSGAVVTVDQDRLFAGSAWGRRLQAEFEQAGVELTAENDRLAAQLSDEEAQLTQQRATLDPAEFRKLADAFDARASEVRRERAQAVQDLNNSIDAEQAAFFQAVAPLIGQLMQERGAVLVVDRRTVLLSADGIDITSDLIARADAELGDGSDQPEVSPEPSPAPEVTPEAGPEPATGSGN